MTCRQFTAVSSVSYAHQSTGALHDTSHPSVVCCGNARSTHRHPDAHRIRISHSVLSSAQPSWVDCTLAQLRTVSCSDGCGHTLRSGVPSCGRVLTGVELSHAILLLIRAAHEPRACWRRTGWRPRYPSAARDAINHLHRRLRCASLGIARALRSDGVGPNMPRCTRCAASPQRSKRSAERLSSSTDTIHRR